MNGHVGRDADGYGGVHGGMGFGTRDAEGERILEFSDPVGMVVCNTFFKKEDSKLIYFFIFFGEEDLFEKSTKKINVRVE